MSKKKVTVEDETYGGALKKALDELGVTVDEVEVKTIQEGQSGFLGFLSRPYKLKVTLKSALKERKIIKKEDSSKHKNSTYSLTNHEEGIFIIVEEPMGLGKKLVFEEVKQELKNMGLRSLDEEALKTAMIRVNYGMLIKIAPPDPEFKVDIDSNNIIKISKDKMSVTLTITKPFGKGRKPTLIKIIADIKNQGVTVPINEKLIKKNIEKEIFDQNFEVAKGLTPIHGRDAYIKWYSYNEEDKLKITISEDGTVDFHKVLNISNVRVGEVIGELIKETTGIDGYNVFNSPILARPGRPMLLKPGNNVELSSDGSQFISSIDGQLLIRKNVPSVKPIFEVRGNVDISTGDIEFVGNVIVYGDVEDGFEVKAEGNIDIKGTVNCSRIEASGNVIVSGGFLGKEKGEIISNSSVGVKFVENGIIKCENNLIVDRAIMHSKVSAGKNIYVKGKRGLIVGGSTNAGEEIEAITIGSHMGTKTLVSAGVSLTRKEKLLKLDEELEEIIKNGDKLNKTLRLFDNIIATTGYLSDEQKSLNEKTLNILKQLDTRRREIDEEKNSIENDIVNSSAGRISAENIIYPGTTVYIRQAVLMVNDIIKCSSLYNDGEEVRIGPL